MFTANGKTTEDEGASRYHYFAGFVESWRRLDVRAWEREKNY